MSQEWKRVPVELLNRAVMAITNTSQMHPTLEDLQAMIAAPVPPQGDAQPVAWVHMRNGEPDYDREIVISSHCGDVIGDGDSWVQVYTHADAGEFESLLAAAVAVRDEWRKDQKKIASLQAQLAERDALELKLAEVQADSHELFGDRELFAAQRDKARNLLKRAENCVSEIAATGRIGAIELASDIRTLYLSIDAEHVRPEFVFSDSPDGCAAEAKYLRSLKAESSQHD